MGNQKIYKKERKEVKKNNYKCNLTYLFNSFVNEAVIKIKTIINYVDIVLNGPNDYSPYVKDILSKYGNQILSSVTIVRSPFSSRLTSIINTLCFGTLKKKLQNSHYEKLFHIKLVFTTKEGTTLMIEKNEAINMKVNPVLPKDSESKTIPIIQLKLSVNTMLDNTKKLMKCNFFSYSVCDNNCQDFILAILNSNNMGNQEDRTFVKQNIKKIFSNLTTLRKINYLIYTPHNYTINNILMFVNQSHLTLALLLYLYLR
jgi:hypothetical protein